MTERSQAADPGLPPSHPAVPPPPAKPPAPFSPPSPLRPPAAQLPPPTGGPPPTGSAPATASPPLPDVPADLDQEEPSTLREFWLYSPCWLASMVVHLLLVLVLALLTTVVRAPEGNTVLNVALDDQVGSTAEELNEQRLEVAEELAPLPALTPQPIDDLPAPSLAEALGPIVPVLPGGGIPAGTGGEGEMILDGAGQGNALELRLSGDARAALLQQGGGTPQSEAAVRLALQWLAEHQNYDGSWTFEHGKSPRCHNACSHPGFTPGKVAATALALLPFLGNGQTHRDGEHRRTVEMGLKYLVRAMQRQGENGSLWEPGGTMYGHGLATIALCEAYGMTRDVALQSPAQAAVNFIVYAQHTDGGWRYQPQTPGDTSVVGWQVMALKSAQMAYLRVPQKAMRDANYFLDRVQSDRGAMYGYQGPDQRRPTTSAIGLLCRMYLGWERDHPPLQKGVQILGHLGPSTDKTSLRNNMYYNYYATQVMHHAGGYSWKRWNEVMREYLIRTQDQEGHQKGSWLLEGNDEGFRAGGRLYCTALAAMTLEVYYRYMPLYREQSTRNE